MSILWSSRQAHDVAEGHFENQYNDTIKRIQQKIEDHAKNGTFSVKIYVYCKITRQCLIDELLKLEYVIKTDDDAISISW